MSELWFKIGMSGILGCLLFITVGFGIYMIADADNWAARLSGALGILLGILVGFFIACLWSVGIRGLE